MGSATRERLRLEADLRSAVALGQLQLAYQPIVQLDSGDLVGFEALVRWNHPRLGHLPPSAFIGLAEETGQIDEIGGWVLREACAAATRWARGAPGALDLQLSVNVSGRQLTGTELVPQVSGALDRSFLALGSSGGRELHRLVRGVIELGRTLELETVAEGIETITQRDLLRADGCRFGQGYLFAQPVDDVTALGLARRTTPLSPEGRPAAVLNRSDVV